MIKRANKTYLFCGVGGSGMSALAIAMVARGATVYGSDRNYDRGLFPDHYNALIANGVIMQPQDGSGVTIDLSGLVVSSAIESSIPDVKVAQDLNIPIIKRAELLSEIANASQSVTVAGTNGKSTVTGMIGWILSDQRFNPTILNGGGMLNFNRQNAVIGQSDHMVLETDESDGSVTNFHPKIAVLTNISDDHKDMKELEHIFGQYLMQSEKQVLNIDCPHVRQLSTQYPNAKTYTMENIPVDLNLIVPGKHNISNALAAIEVAGFLGVNKKNAVQSLNKFKGVTSRLEVVGRTPNGITIIDDFAHNPDKIIASLKTLKENDKRLHLVYQPQGFGPLKHQKDDLINIFSNYLNKNEFFYMLEAFYAGGTADKSVSSQEIVSEVSKKIPKTSFYSKKEDVFDDLIKNALSGDLICIMGARDDGLRNLAKKIYKELI